MQELIKIKNNNGSQAVSARDLHEFLEVGTKFTEWCNRMFDYGFQQDMDFIPILGKSTGGRPTTDYALTLDCAKEIAMIQRTARGKEAREYFIECERRLKAKPLSVEEQIIAQSRNIIAQAESMLEMKSRLSDIETDVLELKAATQTRPDYYTIVGYATLHKVKIGLQMAAKLGGKASRLCREHGYPTEEIPDPRFGKVKMYPKSVLQTVFDEAV